MKPFLLFGLLAPSALLATTVFAGDKAVCLDAASKGQRLRDAHKLVEAREQLRVCAAAVCPAVVQGDCANWLVEVDKALPSVVVTAKNAAGADLVDVKVSVDGQPLVPKLDGRAVPMNAGVHTFHFEEADGTSLDQQVLVKEGEKSQAVAVALGPALPAPPSVVLAPSSPTSAGASDSGGSSRPARTLGWVLGGLGVAGLGVGGAFGVVAIQDKNNADCVNSVCEGPVNGIKTAALISDIGWIAGGVLLAGGAALVIFTPGRSRESTARIEVAPIVAASGGGIAAGGEW